MNARVRLTASLRRRIFLEASRIDRVQLLMLPPMRHYFVRVRADELAFQAMKMGCFVLTTPCNKKLPIDLIHNGAMHEVIKM